MIQVARKSGYTTPSPEDRPPLFGRGCASLARRKYPANLGLQRRPHDREPRDRPSERPRDPTAGLNAEDAAWARRMMGLDT